MLAVDGSESEYAVYLRPMTYRWEIKTWEELSTTELYQLLALRAEVFVVEQNCPYQDIDGKDLHSLHVLAWDDDHQLIAYSRLVKPGISYAEWSIGRVVTSMKVRRKGVGKLLMQRALSLLDETARGAIRISAQCYLETFYQGFGFVSLGEPYLEDDIPHIEMLRS